MHTCPNQNIVLIAYAVVRMILVYYPDYNDPKFGQIYALGPNYREKCIPFLKNIKEKALEHVLLRSQCSLQTIMDVMGTIEQEARAAYADDMVKDLNGPDFQKIMAEDGCIFLLLAFSVLGAGTELEFPESDIVFGTGCVNKHMDNWLESMFLVGNQVPSIVIDKLMDLSFFKKLKKTIKCKKQQQQELGKRTLHEFLIVDQNPRPMDLLHCLQSVLLGPKGGSNTAVGKKDDDIEETVSVSRLFERGIKFQNVGRELGIRAMRYKCNIFGAVLLLPILKFDRNTGMLINCLLKYETAQEPRGVEPEACSFFKFMCELIRTSKDVEVLECAGVIQGQSKIILAILESLEGMVSSVNMHSVNREIIGNRPLQWKKPLKCMTFTCTTLMFLFAFMQMLYGILAYYKPGKT